MIFRWVLTDDVDRDYQDIDIFYRVELIDSLKNRVIVLDDMIPHSDFESNGIGQTSVNLDQSFLSYNLDFDYFNYCEFSYELSLE